MKKYIAIILALIQSINIYSQNNSLIMNTNKKESTEIIRYNIPESSREAFEKAYTDAGKFLKASPF